MTARSTPSTRDFEQLNRRKRQAPKSGRGIACGRADHETFARASVAGQRSQTWPAVAPGSVLDLEQGAHDRLFAVMMLALSLFPGAARTAVCPATRASRKSAPPTAFPASYAMMGMNRPRSRTGRTQGYRQSLVAGTRRPKVRSLSPRSGQTGAVFAHGHRRGRREPDPVSFRGPGQGGDALRGLLYLSPGVLPDAQTSGQSVDDLLRRNVCAATCKTGERPVMEITGRTAAPPATWCTRTMV